ncbi:AAA family ATPase [Lentisphaerota bacterium ZTH]|nr:AAA family ATPase [Lentisphaerota bacterium]WET05702.1 AAA family ATPase [Lentisphaerota bacterium ZTH]
MSMDKRKSILVSIHPQHLAKIISGEKCFEYRKTAIKEVKYAALYAISPVKMIVAIAKIEEILSDKPQIIWRKTRGSSGITYRFFQDYFKNKKTAHAFKLGQIKVFDKPIALSNKKLNLTAPQSFIYLGQEKMKWLESQKRNSTKVKSSLILIAGVHGAGKTTISQKLFTLFGYNSITASNLIALNGGKEHPDKSISDLKDNQAKLLKGLSNVRNKNYRTILDGHFCLINKSGDIEDIPLKVFEQMNPTCIVLAKPSIEILEERLKQRETKMKLNVDLQSYYKRECKHAEYVAHNLSIPIYEFDTGISRRYQFKRTQDICKNIRELQK